MQELEIVDILNVKDRSESYELQLQTKAGGAMFSMRIGFSEARALVWAQHDITPSRPTAHDLLLEVLKATGYVLQRVEIVDYQDGIFFAVLVLESETAPAIRIDARPSDALALAMKCQAPFFVSEKVLELVDSKNVNTVSSSEKEETRLSLQQLQAALDEAIEKEDFERAATLNELILKRKRD